MPGHPHEPPATRLEAHYGDRVVRCFAERPRSLDALLREAVARNAQGDAYVAGEERLSWAAFDARVERVAASLAERGVERGDRVALLLGNRLEFIVASFAAWRLGAIIVPLNVRYQTPELAYALGDCGATVIVHEVDVAEKLPVERDVPALRRRISAGACPGSEPFAALLAGGGAAPRPGVEEEDTAAILYTSGTSGHPKGAMLSHLNIVHSAMHYEWHMGLGSRDRSVAAVPLSHVTGLVANVATMARCAGALVVLPAFKAADFIALAERERMTHTLIVPAMYNLCLLQPDFARRDLSAWRVGGYGGAPMPEATIAALGKLLPGLSLMNAYGATETASPATLMPGSETAAHADSVGKALPCAELAVMDDDGRELPPGEAGEIWIKGPMVVKAYWNAPAASAASFLEGYWKSGDIGSIDADGFVRILDRKKDVINRGGYKVFTAEVENVLARHPAVLECAVVAKPCPVLGERVHAFVTWRDSAVTADDLGRYCAERLADYKVPESFTLGASPLPRNANGKVMKRVLREQVPPAAPVTRRA
jgi:acyl-CoA synthetase (AMP-forming)/AMP-acid ligase II